MHVPSTACVQAAMCAGCCLVPQEVSSLTAGLEKCVVALVSQLACLSTEEGTAARVSVV